MAKLSSLDVDEIVKTCMELYKELPKTGKPTCEEWTVISCVIQRDMHTKKIEVVSLGTGSKCIGASKMSPEGDILNDSHAEVMARRGFLLYLYDQIENVNNSGNSSIFFQHNNLITLKENIEFIFYSSQLPCGDASIVPKTNEDFIGEVVKEDQISLESEYCLPWKKRKTEVIDIHRTGAKCLPNDQQDTKQTGPEYHILGQVRTKPGRGDKTLSVSCSDKIARWIHLGIQGGLLDLFLSKPIFISYLIFGAGVPYCNDSLRRALLLRNLDYTIDKFTMPEIYQSKIAFPDVKGNGKVRPAPTSIVWVKREKLLHEVAVQGRKLGSTKKKSKLTNNTLCISKISIFKRFLEVLNKSIVLKNIVCGDNDINTIPYNVMKRKSTKHLEKWKEIKEKFFKTWTVKPDIWNFTIKK